MDAIQNFFSSIGDTLEPLFATLKHALLAGFPYEVTAYTIQQA